VNTPPLLVGAAVLFWGWQTGLLPAAIAIAAILEGSRLVGWRWDLSRRDVTRVADLCRLILVGMAVYLAATRGVARAVLVLVEWFPLAAFPLVAAQAYGPAGTVDLRTFFLILRRSGGREGDPEPESLQLGYPYLALCVLSASAANVRTPWFYAGVLGLAAWALWPARSRAFSGPAWVGLLALAAGLGYGGQIALHELQGLVEGTLTEWFFDYSGWNVDPFRSSTAIGHIGRLKLSDRILLRVDTGGPRDGPPILLHEATYNVYTPAVWGAVDAEFRPVPPAGDRRTWTLEPATAATGGPTISAYLKRGRGLVPLPNGTFRVEGLLALEMERNRLGAVKVEEGLGLITYRTLLAPGISLNGRPNELDLKVPRPDAPIVARLAAELGLPGQSPREVLATVAAYFQQRFRYSTFLQTRQGGATALEEFLLRTRAGHCEYFATATVLMLRAAGIPARYATGYSVQEWSGREGVYVVRARHAHSWALVWADGAWRDFDTTPAVWAAVEGAAASRWQSLYDLASWGMFLFARWRWGDHDSGPIRYAGWLLVPLFGILAWRFYFKKRLTRADPRGGDPPARRARPGEDSEFYLVEQRLGELGLGRQPWEPVSHWVQRLEAAPPPSVSTGVLASLAALHSRYRFDPEGITPEERQRLASMARAWLAETAR
jgi:transglutaminase-like putative cysteine protease